MIGFIDEEVTGEWFWSSGGNERPFEMGPGGTKKRSDKKSRYSEFYSKGNSL